MITLDTYAIDFYSNDHQEDLSIEADLVDYGKFTDYGDEYEILEDPTFHIDYVANYEGIHKALSNEETRRVKEILNNIYWSKTHG